MSRKLLVTGATAVILGGALAGAILTRGSAGNEPAADPGLPPATATVIRTTLMESETVSGTLDYGARRPIAAGAGGTLTWIAPVGSTVRRGSPLFKVDERPVVDLYGSLPLYRPLGIGIEGADVNQLERNLVELGYTGFTVDGIYDGATAAAVRTWQADLGLPVTGTVEPGQIKFTRQAVRVAEHTARVGDPAEDRSPVLSYTGTRRRVTVQLEVADRALAAEGRAVTIKVPGRRALKGRIAKVGAVLSTKATSPAAGTSPATATTAAANARIDVTVTIANQRALGSLDAAPVDVDFVSRRREDVLAVPVAALLALPKGGFGVQTVSGDATRIVSVKTGVFAAGQVEVSGSGISEGVTVGIPR